MVMTKLFLKEKNCGVLDVTAQRKRKVILLHDHMLQK